MIKLLSPLKTLGLLSLLGAISVCYGQSVGPDVDRPWLKTYPAGPFSVVNTSSGTLDTSIKLFSIPGNGSTSLDFVLRHRSNVNNGTAFTARGAGRGWRHSYESTVSVIGSDLVQHTGGSSQQYWIRNDSISPKVRRPGTRDDLRDLTTAGAWSGYEVETLNGRMRWGYSRLGTDPLRTLTNLAYIADPYGNVVEIFYDANKRVTRVEDASNLRTITLQYVDTTATSLIDTVTLNYPGGSKVWDLNYTNGNLTEIRYPDPGTGDPRPVVNLTYDSNSNIIVVKDFYGNRWAYNYSIAKAIDSVTSNVALTSFFQPSPSSPTTQSWNNGTTFTWTFENISGTNFTDDEKICTIVEPYRSYSSPLFRTKRHVYFFNTSFNGGNAYVFNPIKRIQDPPVNSLNFWETYAWNLGDGTLASYRDRFDNATTYTYDSGNRGLVFTKTIPANGYATDARTTFYNYDATLRLILEVAPGRDASQFLRTAYYYNTAHSVIKSVIDPKVNPVTGATAWPGGLDLSADTTYNSRGEVTSFRKGTDGTTVYGGFDSYGNPTTITSPDAKVTTLGYNTLGEKTSESGPAPLGTTTFSYDALGRLRRVERPGAAVTTYRFDASGRTTSVTDPNGWVTTTSYDQLGRAASTVQTVDATPANNIITSYLYDPAGVLLQVTNGKGSQTKYEYDVRDNLTRITLPNLTTWQFTYNNNSQVLTKTDGKGQVTQFVYNAAGQLTAEQRKSGSATVSQTLYTYTPKGDLLTMTDESSVTATAFGYDSACRLISHHQPVPNKTVVTTYDGSSRRSTLSVFQGTATTGTPLIRWTYGYDTGLRLSSVKEKLGVAAEITLADLTYHDAGLLKSKTFFNGTSSHYTYGPRGTLSQIEHRRGAVAQQTISPIYNLADVPTATSVASLEGAINNTVTTQHTSDRSYRLTGETRTGSLLAFQNFTAGYGYDKNSTRTSTLRGAVNSAYSVDASDRLLSGDGLTLGGYDANGSPTTLTGGSLNLGFTYNRDNRLIGVSFGSGSPDAYVYNGLGHRVKKTSGGVVTNYLYDGSTVLAEYPGTGSLYYSKGIGMTNGVSGARFTFREDQTGSTVGVVHASGNIASRSLFDGFGQEYLMTAGLQTPFRFLGANGAYRDASTGLILMGDRYYVARFGRFLTQDPLGQKNSLNAYALPWGGPYPKGEVGGAQVRPALPQPPKP